MEHELRIQAATPADLPQLLTLYRQFTSGDPGPSHEAAMAIWERFQRYPGSRILVGFVGETLVTSCVLVVIPNLTRGGLPYGLIENVITDSRQRKRGHGTAILKAAVAAAWDHDCYKVMLLTGSNNLAAIDFYREAGLEQSKTGFQVRRLPARPSSIAGP